MNQITAPDSEQGEALSPSVTTGQRLREAREALGLSRDEVAQELRLHEKLIGALEAGERSQLPPDTFISGYLRAYARLLGLPAEQLIAEYLAERVTPAVYRATDRTGVKVVSSRDPKFRLVTYAVIAVTVLLSAAWWTNERYSLISLTAPQAADGGDEEQDLAAQLPLPMPLYQEQSPEESSVSQVPADQTLSAAAGSGEAAPPATAPERFAEPAAAVTPVAPPPQQPAVAPAAEVAKPVAPAPIVVAEPLAATVAQSSLAMEFQAASWTQVEDAKGRVLVYETIPAGRKLQLQGVAPFKVFLGYAPGVLVYYNGTLFSHAAYHRGDLARFRVGSSADNRSLDR